MLRCAPCPGAPLGLRTAIRTGLLTLFISLIVGAVRLPTYRDGHALIRPLQDHPVLHPSASRPFRSALGLGPPNTRISGEAPLPNGITAVPRRCIRLFASSATSGDPRDGSRGQHGLPSVPLQLDGVILQPVLKPVIVGLEADQDSRRPSMTRDQDLSLRSKLRARQGIRVSGSAASMAGDWRDCVVPVSVESVRLEVDVFDLCGGDLDRGRIGVSIQGCPHPKSLCGGRGRNQADDDLVGKEWLPAPVRH